MPELAVEQILLLLLLAFAVAVAAKFLRVPYTVALVLAGLAVAFVPGMPSIELSPSLVLYVILPAILFQGGLNLNFSDLHRNLRPIALFAVPGIVLSTVVAAAAFHLLTGIGFRYCLLFGALISPTDPISVLAILKKMQVPHRLKVLLEGESLFNDGTGVVLFRTLLAVAVGVGEDFNLGITALQFVVSFAGGAGFGLLLGFLAYKVLKRINDHLLEVMITLLVAYGSFVLPESVHLGHFHFSGVIACAVAALFLGNMGVEYAMQPKTREAVGHFWESIDFILNSILFLMIGLEIQVVPHEGAIFIPILAGLAAHLAGRAVATYPSSLLVPNLNFRWTHVLFWGGLKGSIPLALVLQLKGEIDPALYNTFLTTTFAVVLFSLVAQALTMAPLLRLLRLEEPGAAEEP
jgi:CPA1 family monovalent cation:H+ antiporter